MDTNANLITRNHNIDMMKGACILFVIITHYNWNDSERGCLIFPLLIEMAVPVFIVLTGYVYTLSYQKCSISILSKEFFVRGIVCRLIRYIIPFTIVFLIEYFVFKMYGMVDTSIRGLISSFLQGGIGPGSYYFPVMIQLVFIFPILLHLISSYGRNALLLSLVANVAYEIVGRFISMNESVYRIVALRYLFIFSFGIFVALYDIEKRHFIYLSALSIVGGGFAVITHMGLYNPCIFSCWTSTCMLSSWWILPFVISFLKIRIPRFSCLEVIGKASYNVYLVQMIFFNSVYLIYNRIESQLLELIICVLICILLGIIFYYMENPITNQIIRIIKKKI